MSMFIILDEISHHITGKLGGFPNINLFQNSLIVQGVMKEASKELKHRELFDLAICFS